jgi:hypothetical protein
MDVRELLRCEIWSKKTTRRILVTFGVVLVVWLLGFEGWQGVSRHWLAKGERAAAQIALQRIDEWKNVGLKSPEFIAAGERARKAMGDAEAAARTDRDRATVFLLNICVATITEDRIRRELTDTSSDKITPEQRAARVKYLSDISRSQETIRRNTGNACERLRKTLY